MGRISTYLQVSLDGYYAGPNGEIDWFKDTEPDPEFEEFSLEHARGESTLLLERTSLNRFPYVFRVIHPLFHRFEP